MIFVITNDDLLPVWGNKEARLAAATANDIDLSIAGEIRRNSDVGPLALPNDVFFPIAFRLYGMGSGHEEEQECELCGFHLVWLRVLCISLCTFFKRSLCEADLTRLIISSGSSS